MREKLRQISAYMAKIGINSPRAEQIVADYLKLYDELDVLESNRQVVTGEIDKVKKNIKDLESEYSRAKSEYENNVDDMGDKYLVRYINAMDYAERELALGQEELEGLSEILDETESMIKERTKKLPESSEEADKIIEEVLSELEKTFAENARQFEVLRNETVSKKNKKKMTGSVSGDDPLTGSGLGE